LEQEVLLLSKLKTNLQVSIMKKVFHLSSCNTNQRILKEIGFGEEVDLQDIKSQNIDEKTLGFLKNKVGSYEALFSKRAMKFRSMGLNEMNLSENDYKKYMLEEYTFLKRPFIILEDQVFVGNAKKTVEAANEAYQAMR
jgi:arsenate reductase